MKIRYGLALLLTLCLSAVGCASGGGGSGPVTTGGITGSGAELLTQGARPQQTENTQAAQQALDDAEDATDPAAARALYGQALTAAQAAITAIPDNPLAHRQAALAYLGLERFEEAGLAFDRATELRPIYELEDIPIRERAWIGLYQEAAPLVNSGDYEQAATLFEQANDIYSSRPEAMITLGQIYAQMRRHDEALANLDRAMTIINSGAAEEMDSATVAGWHRQAEVIPFTRAQVLADAGRLEEAADGFRAIADEDPSNLQALKNLAAIRIQLGDVPGAFAVYNELMDRPGLTSQDYYQIGVGFYQGDDLPAATRAFASAVEESPRDRDAIEMWARSLQEDSVWTEVGDVARRWIELDPYNQNGHLILAQSLVQTGDTEAAGDVVRHIETLEVQIGDLQLTRFGTGGAQVSGTLQNKTLSAGAPVTVRFTFYDEAGNPMGTVTETVSAGGEGMSELFQVEFNSADPVGGYGYTVSVG